MIGHGKLEKSIDIILNVLLIFTVITIISMVPKTFDHYISIMFYDY